MIEGKNHPPFGIKSKRFLALGYHPQLETRPGTAKYPDLFPGRYDGKLPRKFIFKVPGWKRQQELEEFCRKLSYRGDHILKEREWRKTVNGPGWQDIHWDIPQIGVKFSTDYRFPVESKFGIPGPGTYGKNHNPYTRIEEKSRGKGFSFSSLPSFEFSKPGSRSLNIDRPYHLPPNLYKMKSCTDELISKRGSKKGPYQIFTVERFPNRPLDNLRPLSVYKNPLDISHPQNAYKGLFYKCGKDSIITSRLVLNGMSLVPRKDYILGPGSYDPWPAPVVTQAWAPFNSSTKEVRPRYGCGAPPPPGRYNPFGKRKILGDGMKSVFLSKTKRDLFKTEKYSWFDV